MSACDESPAVAGAVRRHPRLAVGLGYVNGHDMGHGHGIRTSYGHGVGLGHRVANVFHHGHGHGMGHGHGVRPARGREHGIRHAIVLLLLIRVNNFEEDVMP